MFHVKIAQTPEGPKFVRVLPPVPPKPEPQIWPQLVGIFNKMPHRGHGDGFGSLREYIQTRADQQ